MGALFICGGCYYATDPFPLAFNCLRLPRTDQNTISLISVLNRVLGLGGGSDAQSHENAISFSPRMSEQVRNASIPNIPCTPQRSETSLMDGFNITIWPPRSSWTLRTMRPLASPPAPSDRGPGSLPLPMA